MNKQQVFDYALKRFGVSPDYPWADIDGAVLRHCHNRKWFALIMSVSRKKLGLSQDDACGEAEVLNVKCEPLLLGAVIEPPKIIPAYHMNREHWVSIILDGGASDEQIFDLLDLSYSLTATKKKGGKQPS